MTTYSDSNGVLARLARIDERTESMAGKIDKLFDLHDAAQRDHGDVVERLTRVESQQELLHGQPAPGLGIAKLVPVASVVGGGGVGLYVLIELLKAVKTLITAG